MAEIEQSLRHVRKMGLAAGPTKLSPGELGGGWRHEGKPQRTQRHEGTPQRTQSERSKALSLLAPMLQKDM